MIRYDHYTDKFVKVSDRECPWCKAVCASTDKYCHECGWHIADTPQTDCETCRHYKLACELFSEVCKYEPTTQNSNLTFEIDTPQTEICDTCKYRSSNVFGNWCVGRDTCDRYEADTPQKELTAKCLNCHNAKACKEKHWDGCIYEPQTDCDDIYPLVIIEDRYTGVYSNGKYTAWNMYFEDIPREIDEDDVTCRNFWHECEEIVGLGDTPNEAVEDLRQKMGRVQI